MRLRSRYFWIGVPLALLALGAVMQIRAQLSPADAPISKSQAIQTAREYIGQRVQRLGAQIEVTRVDAELGWAPESVFAPQESATAGAQDQRRSWIVRLYYKGLTPDTHLLVYVDAISGTPAGNLQTR